MRHTVQCGCDAVNVLNSLGTLPVRSWYGILKVRSRLVFSMYLEPGTHTVRFIVRIAQSRLSWIRFGHRYYTFNTECIVSNCGVNRLTDSVCIFILGESRGVIMIEHSASPSRACSNEYLWLRGTDKPQCTCAATGVQFLQKLYCNINSSQVVPSSVRQGTLSLLRIHDKEL